MIESSAARARRGRGRGGFTLVELLVVIGIIALLISILLPALNKAKLQAQRVACMSSQRQLMMAWGMYCNDNRDWLPMNWPDGNTRNTTDPRFIEPQPSKFVPWFVGPGRAATLNPPLLKGGGNNDEAIIRGSVYPYVKNIKVYRCAGDPGQRLVSYGVNCFLNGELFTDMVFKRSQIRDATRTFVLIDEYDLRGMETSTGYNQGAFAIHPAPNNTWVDYPGMYHLNASVISFLDGHAEAIVWDLKSTRTITGNNQDVSADPRDLRKLQALRGARKN